MTQYTFDQAVLDALPPLARGAHSAFDERVCAMEALARACGLGTTDSPQCASPVIIEFTQILNDSLPSDEDRDRYIRPLLPLMVGTANDGHDIERAFMCADAAVRVFAVAAMRNAGFSHEANVLRELMPIRDRESALSALSAAWSAESAAARSAAESAAARSAAWSAAAAWSARLAARSAARSAAWSAESAAALSAAESAARSAAAYDQATALLRDMCLIGRDAS